MKAYESCRFCGKPKTAPASLQKGVSKLEFDRDPYCSRSCLAADLGVADPHSPVVSTQGRLGKQGPRA